MWPVVGERVGGRRGGGSERYLQQWQYSVACRAEPETLPLENPLQEEINGRYIVPIIYTNEGIVNYAELRKNNVHV